jgi:hypothetical protein
METSGPSRYEHPVETSLQGDQAEATSAPTRRVMEDDVYKGLFIPTGTVMVGNIWYASCF